MSSAARFCHTFGSAEVPAEPAGATPLQASFVRYAPQAYRGANDPRRAGRHRLCGCGHHRDVFEPRFAGRKATGTLEVSVRRPGWSILLQTVHRIDEVDARAVAREGHRVAIVRFRTHPAADELGRHGSGDRGDGAQPRWRPGWAGSVSRSASDLSLTRPG